MMVNKFTKENFLVFYLRLMMAIIGRALQAISEVDWKVKEELAGLPEDFLYEMKVLPDVAGLVIKKTASGQLVYLGSHAPEKPDVSVMIKHPSLAFLLLSFQEGTALAFAHDRAIVNGDISMTMRVMRCLDRLESCILPKFAAKLALKRYPADLGFVEKVTMALKIYARLILNLFNRSAVA